MSRYSYEELKAKALAPDAEQHDIDNLGDWFVLYGDNYWNGEYFEIDSYNRLYPIYEEDEDGELVMLGFEIR